MSHPRDEIGPLEAELESLRPAPPSPELRTRIERDLGGQATRAGVRRRHPLVFWIGGAAAAAACVVAALTWRQAGPPETGRAVVQATRPATESGESDERPALSSYRRAASLSADALGELLDRHSARTLAAPAAADAPVTASSRASMSP